MSVEVSNALLLAGRWSAQSSYLPLGDMVILLHLAVTHPLQQEIHRRVWSFESARFPPEAAGAVIDYFVVEAPTSSALLKKRLRDSRQAAMQCS